MSGLFTKIIIACFLASLVGWLTRSQWRRMRKLHRLWLRLTPLQRAAVCSALAIWIVYGGLKPDGGTNEIDGAGSSAPMMTAARPSAGMTEEMRFLRYVESVTTNAAPDYARPEGAQYCSAWWELGCEDAAHRINFGDWSFPLGTADVSSVAAFSRGIVAARIRDRASWITAIGAPLTVHPFDSDLWWGEGTNDSRVVTFRNFYFRGMTNDPVNAQVRLYPSGRIEVCSNDVMTTYGRIEPFDLDRDGLANAIDPHPFASDGNCYGQGENWVRASFTNLQGVAEGLTNVKQILDVGYANWVDAQVGEGQENGLYKFTVTFPVPPVRPTLLTVGDLSVVVTTAGEYVFLLEMLEEYEVGLDPYADSVEFSWTDVVGGASSPRMLAFPPEADWDVRYELNSYVYEDGYEVWVRPSKAEEGRILIVPQLGIAPAHQEFDDMAIPDPLVFVASLNVPRSASVSYVWTEQPSGEVVSSDALLSEDGLLGVDWIEVEASCKGHTWRGSVDVWRRVRTPDLRLRGPGLIVCEDAYTNRPGEVVAASSTAAALEAAWAVRSAGTLTLSSADDGFVVQEDGADDPIELPYSWRVNGEEFGSRQFWVEKTSGTAVGATGAFTLDYEPDDSSDALTASTEVMVVKIKVEAVEIWPENRVRHIFGPREKFRVFIDPPAVGVTVLSGDKEGGSEHQGQNVWKIFSPEREGVFAVVLRRDLEDVCVPCEVIAPQCLRGANPREPFTYELLQNGAPWLPEYIAGVIMHIDVFVEANYVSFKNVLMFEGFSLPSERIGCYTNVAFFTDAWLQHGESAGASNGELYNAIKIDEGNAISGGDVAGNWFNRPYRKYGSGSFQLKIPLKWFVEGGAFTNALPDNTQQIWLFNDGRMRIQKNGISFERNLRGECYEVHE